MAIKVKKDVGISPTHSTFRQYTAMINAVRRAALIAIVRISAMVCLPYVIR